MAASLSGAVVTPRKSNCCIFCGVRFITFAEEGKIVFKKFDTKLKINEERRKNIEDAVEQVIVVQGENGICRKCFRAVQKILKLEKDVSDLRNELIQSMRTTMSMPTKRMLRSPNVALPVSKSLKAGEIDVKVRVVTPVKIAPFRELSNSSRPTTTSDVGPSTHSRAPGRSLGPVFSRNDDQTNNPSKPVASIAQPPTSPLLGSTVMPLGMLFLILK
ncbi:uncharacterized protein [Argopecten irradians]|uniref:uncharacterized protein n=1 Tax=Argopecten irradians TaxID=31199 RepID=UPI003718EC02